MPEEKKNLIPRVVPVPQLRRRYAASIFCMFWGAFCFGMGASLGVILVIASCWWYRRTWKLEQGRLMRENRDGQFGDDPEDELELHFPFCGMCRVEHETGRHF